MMNNKITPTLQRILDKFEELKGQFVITCSHEIQRFVAIGDDEQDYYYITYDGRRFHWNTCVGKLIRLKGKLDDEDYNEFIRLAKLNHYDQKDYYRIVHEKDVDEDMIKSHRKQMMKVNGTDKFLTDICWDLN